MEKTEWSTTELQKDFEVIGFNAPYVVVIRKKDKVKGSFEFTQNYPNPRIYFNFKEDK